MLKDDALLERIEADYQSAELAPRRRSMLDYAVKLTERPSEMVAADVESLRDAGFSDTDILHIAEITAYYAYVNRIADGLGVTLEGT